MWISCKQQSEMRAWASSTCLCTRTTIRATPPFPVVQLAIVIIVQSETAGSVMIMVRVVDLLYPFRLALGRPIVREQCSFLRVAFLSAHHPHSSQYFRRCQIRYQTNLLLFVSVRLFQGLDGSLV